MPLAASQPLSAAPGNGRQDRSPRHPRRRLLEQAALAIVPPLTAVLVRLVGATLRYEDRLAVGAVRGDLLPGPSIYAFWHRSLLIAAHRFRDRGIAILISRSFDGELIARTVALLGFHPVRGSSSRGGAGGLRQLTLAYQRGRRCAFTADGPRGPALVAKAGPVQLAQLTGASAIGSFALTPARAWRLKTWDGFLIPKPFSRVVITWPALAPVLTASVQSALEEADRLAAPSASVP